MLGRNDAFQSRADHFHRAGRDHVEIEVVTLDLVRQKAVERVDVGLQPNGLAGLVQMFAAHARAEFGIVQQQVGELASLLHQVQLSHPGGLTLEFAGGNPQQLGQHVARVVEAQGLVKIAGEYVALLQLYLFKHSFRLRLMVVLAHENPQLLGGMC